MMWSFGVNAETVDGGYSVYGNYCAKKYDIEPDVSAACYFYAMNKISGATGRDFIWFEQVILYSPS